jgi:hypothetical protein
MIDINKCIKNISQKSTFLTNDNIKQYLENGFLIFNDSIPEKILDEISKDSWDILNKNNIYKNDYKSWDYECIRTNFITSPEKFKSTKKTYNIKKDCQKIWNINNEITNGNLSEHQKNFFFDNQVICNFKKNNITKEPIIKNNMSGWHKDGIEYHYLDHNLAFIVLYAISDIPEGGTAMALDSVELFSKILYSYKKGILFDHCVETGFLTSYIISNCNKFIKQKYKKGDYILMHPFMFHRICYNNSLIPKMLINGAVFVKNVKLYRDDHNYNLHELSIIYNLQKNKLVPLKYKRLNNLNRSHFKGSITSRNLNERKEEYNNQIKIYKYFYDNKMISPIEYLSLGYCTNNYDELTEDELNKKNLNILYNYLNFKKKF